MKHAALVIAAASFGVAFCLVWVAVINYIGGNVQFPAPRGETDFSERFVFFLLGVCPAFLILGAWIGRMSLFRWRPLIAMWAGVFIASTLVEITVRSLRPFFESMTNGDSATHAVLGMFLAWVLAAFAGAWLGGKFF